MLHRVVGHGVVLHSGGARCHNFVVGHSVVLLRVVGHNVVLCRVVGHDAT